MSFVDVFKYLYKCMRIHCKLSALEALKISEIRKKQRLPKVGGTFEAIRSTFCAPVLHVWDIFYQSLPSLRPLWADLYDPNGYLGLALTPNTKEHDIAKKSLFFAFGFLLSWLIFLFIEYQLEVPRVASILVSVSALFGLTLLFPLFAGPRLIVLLMLPSFFASKGRYLLVAYIFITIYANTFTNIANNTMVGLNMIECFTGGGAQETKNTLKEQVKDYIVMIREAFDKLKQHMKSIAEYLKQMVDALAAMTPDLSLACKSRYGFVVCQTESNELKEGWCHVKNTVSHLFFPMCEQVKRVAKDIKQGIVEAAKPTIERVKTELYFDVDMNHKYVYTFNQSKNFTKVMASIGGQLYERHFEHLNFIGYFMFSTKFLLLAVTIWLIINALIYRFRYLKFDSFDNTYINKDFIAMDRQRGDSDSETLIPLTTYEKMRYIETWSFQMTSTEINKLLVGLLLAAVTFCQASVYLGLNALLWLALDSIRVLIDETIKVRKMTYVEVEMNHTGGQTDSGWNSMPNTSDLDVENTINKLLAKCRPLANTPDWNEMLTISILWFIVVVSVLGESYALRSRHYVCGLYYPHRLRPRLVWLYNDILCRRGALVRSFRRSKFQAEEKTLSGDRLTFLDFVCSNLPVVRALLQFLGLYGRYKYCVVCAKRAQLEDTENVQHCLNDECKAVYCKPCVVDSDNRCALCMRAISLGFDDGWSEELDSSDEDVM